MPPAVFGVAWSAALHKVGGAVCLGTGNTRRCCQSSVRARRAAASVTSLPSSEAAQGVELSLWTRGGCKWRELVERPCLLRRYRRDLRSCRRGWVNERTPGCGEVGRLRPAPGVPRRCNGMTAPRRQARGRMQGLLKVGERRSRVAEPRTASARAWRRYGKLLGARNEEHQAGGIEPFTRSSSVGERLSVVAPVREAGGDQLAGVGLWRCSK